MEQMETKAKSEFIKVLSCVVEWNCNVDELTYGQEKSLIVKQGYLSEYRSGKIVVVRNTTLRGNGG